jgi:hypothetical protein
MPGTCNSANGQCSTQTNSPYGTLCSISNGNYCDGSGDCVPTFRVVRVGTGQTTLSDVSAAVFIEERRTDGALMSTISMPTTNSALTLSGNRINEGALSLSYDGHYLSLGGYGAPPGVANIAGTVSGGGGNQYYRAVGRIDATGHVDAYTRLSGAYSTGTIDCATSADGTGFWTGGGGQSSGIWYIPWAGFGGTQINASAATEAQALNVFNGQLYGTVTNGVQQQFVKTNGALPTLPPGLTALLGNEPGHTYSFVMFKLTGASANPDTLYLAEDGIGIRKFTTTDGTHWNIVYTLSSLTGGGTASFRGLAGYLVGTTVTLVGTTADTNGGNRVVVYVDNGSTSAGTVIATYDGSTQVFRGVALSPH